MLSHLSIKNYATVKTLEIEFQPGMTVLTGETGAGKSIILGALGFTLGDRADKTIVRPGASRADISAEFDISQIESARLWLQANDLQSETDEHLCMLRRVVNEDGRSRGYINGSPVTMTNLKQLGEMLIDIHSQHEHQSLLQRSTHQRLLDDFGVDQKLRSSLVSTWKQWQQNHQQLQTLAEQASEYSAQTQLLSYQLSEMEELNIAENEAEELETEFKTLSHADETLTVVHAALAECSGEDNSLANQLTQILHRLRGLGEHAKDLESAITLMESAEIQLTEAVDELRGFSEKFHADPHRLDTVNARLGALHDLARKHKVPVKGLDALMADLRDQLARFENSDTELEQLKANDGLLREQFLKLAKDVSKQRRSAAKKLDKAVNAQLKNLGMPHAELSVTLTESTSEHPSQQGLESVEFLVSTNPGQPPKPLIKVASGGELSRISLAIQVITAQTSETPSLVFDEVDVGIGGGIARVVGKLLRKLGDTTQILCVTHQAQVAGQGHHHFFVSKDSSPDSSLTSITTLDGDHIVQELARMLGGDNFSDESLAHAQQLVANLN
ncbi:MAG TPA: DNA repair protein RecN [Gammaproteobacteria bacterium]|nr:DNA repair protein RecN [Gammaproteobacteria bacterium]